jgi:hypothetical protein
LSIEIQAAQPDFDRDVAPILARRCLDCHSDTESKGGLNLATRDSAIRGGKTGEAIVPGHSDESLLWEQVDTGIMPPKAKLPENEKAVLRAWIDAGAKWGTDPIDPYQATTDRRAGRDWWAFQAIKRPVVNDPKHAIDELVDRVRKQAGLKASPRADRQVLIRRLTFDLIGLPPTPQEVDAFVNDDRPDSYERLVDRLLASNQYGVRWARPWLDLARFGESNGFEYDEFRPWAWPYRDWVVNAFNRDLPYDQFTRQQIAGDILAPNDPNAHRATGFLVAGAFDTPGQNQQSLVMKRVVREDEMEDIVSTVGQTFLGLTIHCARCHDHKFDPIKQADYYRLTASLAGVRHGERDLTQLDPEVLAGRKRIAANQHRINEIESPARAKLRAKHKITKEPPQALATWNFDRPASTNGENLPVTLIGGATRNEFGLKVDGKAAFAQSATINKDLKAKTLEAWVKLDSIEQRGGAVMSLQSQEGGRFDAIVFGENEPGKWMAGSEGFVRTKSFAGTAENDSKSRPVHIAIVYDADGTIRAYRDGKPYGNAYRSSGAVSFRKGQAHVVFGLRHAPAGGNRMLAGLIVRARLYDRSLSSDEVAASFEAAGDVILIEEVIAGLSETLRAERIKLIDEINAISTKLTNRESRAYVVSPRPPDPVHRLIRGNPAQPAELMKAGGLSVVKRPSSDFGLAPDAAEGERRLRLANWIASPDNPLFARVIVNRIWLWHFGSSLVDQPSDFGFNGGKPTNIDLIDWLASELVARGFSLKDIHKIIVMSETYAQTSKPNRDALRVDAGNRLYWRKSPQRLEAEMVRDTMLAVSCDIDLKLDGPGYRDHAVSKTGSTAQYQPVDQSGPEFRRRTLYRTWARGGRSAFLDVFDCPDPSTTSPRRQVTTTPLQALALLNNALTFQMADGFAQRIQKQVGNDKAAQVDLAYRLAFGRKPDAEERDQAVKVVKEHGLATLARAIYNSNEFLYVD